MVSLLIKGAFPNSWKPLFFKKFASRSDCAKFLIRYRQARRCVPRSSRSVFGACFNRGCLRWMASFTCRFLIVDKKGIVRLRTTAPAVLPR